VTLKFDRVLPQVQVMGRAVAHRSEHLSQRGERALSMLNSLPDLAALHQRIDLVRQKDAGYRGAAAFNENLSQRFPLPPTPAEALLIAVDGSQIYPDPHQNVLYYLTNIGTFTYHHGAGLLPEEDSTPFLYYSDDDLRERHGHGALVKNTAINARRNVQEMQSLAEACWHQREEKRPLLGLMDGPLLWWIGQDIPYAAELEADYHRSFEIFLDDIYGHRRLYDLPSTGLVGYVERGDSRFVIRLLHLLSLDEKDITRAELETAGPFEGLADDWLFGRFLGVGERSALMIQQSPQNKRYREKGKPFEIVFFYLNVGEAYSPHVVRIELPMWMAQEPACVNMAHALLFEQCRLAGRYPYCLTRAHELATVSVQEKIQLDNLIAVELLNNAQLGEKSPKQADKDALREGRRRYGEKPLAS
jgi:hypothetical protein